MTTLSFSVPRFGSSRGSVFPPGNRPFCEQPRDVRSYANYYANTKPATTEKRISPVNLDKLDLSQNKPKAAKTEAGDNDRDDNTFVSPEDKAALGRATAPNDPHRELSEEEKRKALFDKIKAERAAKSGKK